jgi:hypothetical protein
MGNLPKRKKGHKKTARKGGLAALEKAADQRALRINNNILKITTPNLSTSSI